MLVFSEIVLEDAGLGNTQDNHEKEFQAVSRQLIVVAPYEVVVLGQVLPHLEQEVALRALGEGLLLRAAAEFDHQQLHYKVVHGCRELHHLLAAVSLGEVRELELLLGLSELVYSSVDFTLEFLYHYLLRLSADQGHRLPALLDGFLLPRLDAVLATDGILVEDVLHWAISVDFYSILSLEGVPERACTAEG